jgi:predicted DNA binding protein
VLPKDLPGALKHLGDSELASLLAAAVDEAKRRDRLRPGLERTSAAAGKALPKSNQRSPARQYHSAAPSLTSGQVNAVRAAFKAGIGPSRIAREFGISKNDVRKVLAFDARERGRRS